MPIGYAYVAIPDSNVPQAAHPLFQHMLDTYASETNKVISLWRAFEPADMTFQPHIRSRNVEDIMKHQLLSERRFFGEFLGLPEQPPEMILPTGKTPDAYAKRMGELASPRLYYLAERQEEWWLGHAKFFDVERERIWIFWRRLLHTAHHRGELVVYLRLASRRVPPIYGPTADFSWEGADPTNSVTAAGRQ